MDNRKSPSHTRRAWHWSVLLLLLLAGCGSGTAPSPTARPVSTTAPSTPTANGAPIPSEDKIGSVFLDLLAIDQSQGADAARTYATDQALLTMQGDLRATLVLDSATPDIVDGTALTVTRIGGRVTQTNEDQIELVMPLAALLDYGKRTNRTSFFHDLADLAHIRSIRRTPIAQAAAGTSTVAPTARSTVIGGSSEGVALTGADRWHAAGITGKGVKIGVLDGSFTNYKQFLPGNVTAKSFRADGLTGDEEADGDSIHGTGCAEIVREMAPDAALTLVAAQTRLEYINAINWLVTTAKVSIITTSWGFWGGDPTDGTSQVARAVDRARAAGVFFAVAAGNSASGVFGSRQFMGHFAATFVDKDGDGFHDFPGAKHDNGIEMHVNRLRYVSLFLQWDDWKQPHVNYDLYLYDANGNEVAHSKDDQAKMPGAVPVEELSALVPIPEGVYTIKVKKVNPHDPDLPFSITFQGAQLEQVTPAGSLIVPADAKGAVAVAAINVKTDVVEDFSSQGPTFDGRKKPDLSGPDDVASYAYASVGEDTFTGTSAATPHVAGAAALYQQAFPRATPDAILSYLTQHATAPKGSRRGENITGAGMLSLDAVPQGASTRPVPQPTGTPVPTAVSTHPAGTPTGTTLFSDDFSSNASGLPEAGYRDGEYHLAVQPDRMTTVTYPQGAVHDASREVYQVQARRVNGGDELLMGLQFHVRDADNYVLFAIWNSGYYATFVKVNGNLQEVAEDAITTVVKAEGTNTVQVTVEGTLLTCAVNGTVVRRIELPDVWTDGGFGMVAGPGTYKAGGEVAFDNYSVTVG